MGNLKCLIIGLDGATNVVLDKLIDSGFMPNLKSLQERGAHGNLRSTIPPVTALAWPTFFTGLNPGKHGLLGWQGPLNHEFRRPWIDGSQVNGIKLWDYLNDAGHTTTIFNVPVTYPPEPLDGVLVSGMLTPSREANFIFPSTIKDSFLAKFPDYETDLDAQNTRRHYDSVRETTKFIEDATRLTKMRGEAFRWLLEQTQSTAGMIVFEAPDRLQHFLWRQISNLPDLDPQEEAPELIRDLLLTCFAELDSQIGQLIEQTAGDCLVTVMSDHGFGPMSKNFYLNDWLADQNWLTYNKMGGTGRHILRLVGRLTKRWLPGQLIQSVKKTASVYKSISWAQTKAYAGLPSEYGIFINKAGREPAGIIQADEYEPLRKNIIAKLEQLRDQKTGQKMVTTVYPREALYEGDFVNKAPDIIFELASGYYISDLTSPKKGQYTSPIDSTWGFHEKDGIFVLAGPQVSAGKVESGLDIIDLFPTILDGLNLPIPNNLDSQSQRQLFTFEQNDAHPLQFTEPLVPKEEANPANYTEEDEQMIADRLSNLGYID